MRRVGIPIIFDDEIWLGGLNYFLSLLSALNVKNVPDLEFLVLTNRPDLFLLNYQKHIKILDCPLLSDSSNRIRRLCRHFSTDIRLAYYSKKYNLSLISHAMPGKRFMPKALYWMPDFQHCHLPHFFSQAELQARDANISRAIERSGHILLSSHSAERDFRTFYPQYSSAKTYVLQFAPLIYPKIKSSQILDMSSISFNAKFFFLPNQFWEHKNHRVVIEALSLLPNTFKVVCTGNMTDYRNTSHIGTLMQLVKDLGLEQRFIILGLVSREHMLELMKNALAVINPSLFEGWSTTVEESKYMGKRLLLSDLDVHREQNPKDAIYFDPKSPSDLAKKMQTVQRDFNSSNEHSRYLSAEIMYPKMVNEFADNYLSIIRSVIDD